MKDPLVSVIIPVFNTEKYIDKCIESVIMQTYSNIEIFLVVGICGDLSLQKCIGQQKKDDRIIIISRKNVGPGDTRNFALNLVSGDFIAFIDADDWISSDYIEKLVTPLIESDADISTCDYIKVFENPDENILERQFTAREGLIDVDFKSYSVDASCVLHAKMYRTSFFMMGQPMLYHSYGEDVAMHILVASKVKKIHALHEPLYFYNQTNENSAIHNADNALKIFDALEYSFQYLINVGLFDLLYIEIKRYLFGTLTFHEKYMSYETMPSVVKEPMHAFLKKYYPDYYADSGRKHTAFGSAILMRIVQFFTSYKSNSIRISNYFGSSSIISQFSKDNSSFNCAHENDFITKMLAQDIHKKLPLLIEDTSQRIDFFFLDFLEERYDLIKIANSYYTKSKALDEAELEGFCDYDIVSSLSEEFMILWEEKCLHFIDILKARFQPKQISLVRTRLSEGFGSFNIEEFYDELDRIKLVNSMACKMEEFFIANFEGINVFDLPEKLLFTDKDSDHEISLDYLNDAVYESMATEIYCRLIPRQ